ncbi:hypothetical protein [Ilumatobacter sp.]|uniref:hypothetical protein n=1 Tax=Ilumatobacter sp. TaxID=1967498 RepID=UPI003752AF3F
MDADPAANTTAPIAAETSNLRTERFNMQSPNNQRDDHMQAVRLLVIVHLSAPERKSEI